jgi:regulator of protease activity HflC (stomatin/prohibitin superfamily)
MIPRRAIGWVLGLSALACPFLLGCCCLGAVDETEYFDRVRTDEVRRLNVGAAQQAAADGDPGADEFLTGDLNLVRVRAVIQYRVASPDELVVRSGDVAVLLARLAEASLSRSLARRGIDPVLKGGRQRIGAEVARDLEEAIARLRLGLEILGRVRRKIILPACNDVDLTVLGIEE